MFLKQIETALLKQMSATKNAELHLISTKFPHQEIMWNYGIFRSGMVWNALEMISGKITK